GPPVCIISIAQQARPNIMYQSDDFRVQLRRSSTVVVSAISGAVLMSDMTPLRRAPRRLLGRGPFHGNALEPLEVALHPDVDEADHQDHEEEAELGKDEVALALLRH